MDEIVRATLRQAAGILLSLTPLFAFWFLTLGGSLLWLELGLVVGTALTIILGLLRLTEGTLLWATVAFFGVGLVAVFALKNLWIIERLGVFPPALFFTAIMISMILNRPFIEEYARRGLTAEQRASVSFVRTCFVLSSFWAAILLIMTLVSVTELSFPGPGHLAYVFIQLTNVGAALAIQAGYVVRVRRRRITAERTAVPLLRPGRDPAQSVPGREGTDPQTRRGTKQMAPPCP